MQAKIRIAAALVAAFLLPSLAHAQAAIQQFGSGTAAHLAMYAGNGRVMDAGGPAQAGGAPVDNAMPGTMPSGLGVVNAGLGYAAFSGPGNAAHNEFLWGYDAGGNALIQIDRVGSGTAPGFNVQLNGVVYPWTAGGGNVTGPNSGPVAGNVTFWNGGLALKDSGIAGTALVTGPAAPVSGNLTAWNGGLLTKDSGIAATSVVIGPAAPVSGNLVKWNGGLLSADSGIAAAAIVSGPGSATAGNVTTWNNAGGTLVKDSGIPLVQGPLAGSASAWANALSEKTAGDLAGILYTSNGGGQLSGIYAGNVSTYFGVSTRVAAADDPPSFNGADTTGVPRNALTALITNNGSLKDSVALMGIADCAVSSTFCWGANPIAMTTVNGSTVKLVGTEIDVQWNPGNTGANNGGGGLFINCFNSPNCGPGVQIGSPVNGTLWSNGVLVGNVASTGTGLGVQGGAAPDSLVNTFLTPGLSYTSGAIRISPNNGHVATAGTNNQWLRWDGANGQFVAAINADDNVIFQNTSSTGGAEFHLTPTGRSLYIGTGSTLPTSATGGYLFIPSMAGVPTGVPAYFPSWANPLVIDSSDSKICFHNGTRWVCAQAS